MAASPASASREAYRLTPAEQALVLDEHAWELYNAHRFGEAVSASERAAHLFERASGADAEALSLPTPGSAHGHCGS